MDEALLRACLIVGPQADYLFLCVHHLIIDGVSWRVLNEDLQSAYTQALEGRQPIVLPQRTHAYPDYVAAMERHRHSYALSLEAPYWKRVETKVASLPHREGRGRFMHLTHSFSAEQTKSVLGANLAAWNMQINDLWLTAVAQSFLDFAGEEAVSVQMEGHGREDIGEELLTDRTIGWFTSMYPVVLEGMIGD